MIFMRIINTEIQKLQILETDTLYKWFTNFSLISTKKYPKFLIYYYYTIIIIIIIINKTKIWSINLGFKLQSFSDIIEYN